MTAAGTGRRGMRHEFSAAELASAPVIAVTPNTDALAALRIMRGNQVRHLPVVFEERCVGLVSETDVLVALSGSTRGPLPTVLELCRRPVPVVDSTSSRAEAARAMADGATDALVVVAEGEVVGVLTAVDLVRSLALADTGALSDGAYAGRDGTP
jgi:CBS domain-containing protein